MPPERNKSGVDVVLKISLQHEYSDLNKDVVTQNLLKLFSLANLHQLVEETLWSKSKLNSLLVGLNLMISLWHENSQNWRKFNPTSITCGWIWRSFNISKKGLSDTQKSLAIISWISTKLQKKLSQRFLWLKTWLPPKEGCLVWSHLQYYLCEVHLTDLTPGEEAQGPWVTTRSFVLSQQRFPIPPGQALG